MFIDYCVELVIKGRKQHIIFTATKNVIPVNIGKIIIEAREFWVVATFNSFTFEFIYRWYYDTNLRKMVANIRNNITTSKNFVWVINENVNRVAEALWTRVGLSAVGMR